MKDRINKLFFVEDRIKQPVLEKYENLYHTFKVFIVNLKLKEWKEENNELEKNG